MTLIYKFYTIGVSEAAAVRVLAYFPGAEAKDVLPEKFVWFQVDLDGVYPETSDQGS